MTDTKRFKVLLLGAAGTGKTTWCQRVSTGQFVAAYDPTPCVLIHLIPLKEDIPINVAVSTTESANADADDERANTAEMDAVFKAWSETCAQKGLSEEEAFLRFDEGTSSWDQAVNAVNIALADLTASEVRQLIQRVSSSKEKL